MFNNGIPDPSHILYRPGIGPPLVQSVQRSVHLRWGAMGDPVVEDVFYRPRADPRQQSPSLPAASRALGEPGRQPIDLQRPPRQESPSATTAACPPQEPGRQYMDLQMPPLQQSPSSPAASRAPQEPVRRSLDLQGHQSHCGQQQGFQGRLPSVREILGQPQQTEEP